MLLHFWKLTRGGDSKKIFFSFNDISWSEAFHVMIDEIYVRMNEQTHIGEDRNNDLD